MLVFNLGTDLVNYNCTGGWKAVAPEGLPEGKESILHNLKLWAIMRLVLHVREPADWRATFCVGSLTIISIMLFAVAERGLLHSILITISSVHLCLLLLNLFNVRFLFKIHCKWYCEI